MSNLQQLGESGFLNINNFPRDILIEFLIRLSVLDLARASLTCKAWYSIISKSEFVDLHLKHSAKRLKYFYSFDRKFENFLDSHKINSNKKVEVEKIRKEGLIDGIIPCMNSSGGLLAYRIQNDSFCYVCNPFTGEEIKVAMGPFWGEGFSTNWCGLGYSVASKEYKILLLADPRKEGAFVPERNCKGALYTLGAGSEWREIPGNVPFNVVSSSSSRPLDFEGSLYFFVCRYSDSAIYSPLVRIGSFDVESENFRLWSGPDNAEIHITGCQHVHLLSIGGVVALAQINPYYKDKGVSIWMLRDKVNEIWVKEINITIMLRHNDYRLCRMNIFGECGTGNSQFPCILLSIYDGFLIYDTKDKSLKEIMPGSNVKLIRAKCIAHTESLVSPKRIMNTVLALPREV